MNLNEYNAQRQARDPDFTYQKKVRVSAETAFQETISVSPNYFPPRQAAHNFWTNALWNMVRRYEGDSTLIQEALDACWTALRSAGFDLEIAKQELRDMDTDDKLPKLGINL